MCKIGFAGDDAPRSVFPTVVGLPRNPKVMIGNGNRNSYISDDAQIKRGVLSIKYPIQHGIVTDWSAMEEIWSYAFRDLNAAARRHPVLMVDYPLNPMLHKEKMTMTMFETFKTPGLYIANQSFLSLIACGRPTGIVVVKTLSHVIIFYYFCRILAMV